MPRPLKRVLIIVAFSLAFYSLLGFLVLPGALVYIANEQLKRYATLPARLERATLNPFTLELALYRFSLGPDKEPALAFGRLYTDLEWNSLWQRTLHLARIQLDQPRVALERDARGGLDAARWFALPPSPKEPATQDTALFPVSIDRIQLEQGQLQFQDLSLKKPARLAWQALSLDLQDFSTRPGQSARLSLEARGSTTGNLSWQGDLQLAPQLKSTGQLQLEKLELASLQPYIGNALPLQVSRGQLSLQSHYQMNAGKTLALTLEQGQLKLASLVLKSATGQPLLQLASLEARETALDLARHQLVIGRLDSRQLETSLARLPDGQLDWQTLFASSGSRSPAKTTGKTPGKSPKPTTQPGWQVVLRNIRLRDYLVHLRDQVPKTPVSLDVGPLSLDLQQFDSTGKTPVQLALDTRIGPLGRLTAKGRLQLASPKGQLQITTRDLDLRAAGAYLQPFVKLKLRSALLDTDLDFDLQGMAPLAFSVRGQAAVNQLHTQDSLQGRDFLKWQSLQLKGIHYQHNDSLEIASVGLDRPYARFIINPDLSTNISELTGKKPAASTATTTPVSRKARQTPATRTASARPATSKALGIRIGSIRLNDGTGDFADLSLQPNFIAGLQNLNGLIGTLDNQKPDQAAQVSIRGNVDKYAPVTIRGSLTPFDPLRRLDITSQFRQVELTTLTPYSGKFAGYRIRKGRLDLDLHYRIQQGRLQAKNKVVIEQLQLGEQVDSPEAVNLPVRLAVALLKDSKGTITLELPVKGDLNDPHFNVMPVIGQTLRNLLVRAVEAPFKLLGSLLPTGGSSDLSSVDFNPGETVLDSAARTTLDQLASALQQRPALTLEVAGTAASSDTPALAQQQLEQEYQNMEYRLLQRKGAKLPPSAAQLQVAESQKPNLLPGIYRTALQQQPPAEWAHMDQETRTDRMREALISYWKQDEALTRHLAQQRAEGIKDYLVKKGLEPQRIYLMDADLVKPEKDGRIASSLNLTAQ